MHLIVDEISEKINKKSADAYLFYRQNNIPSSKHPKGWLSDSAEIEYYLMLDDINKLTTERSSIIFSEKPINEKKCREITSSTYERSQKRLHSDFKKWFCGFR